MLLSMRRSRAVLFVLFSLLALLAALALVIPRVATAQPKPAHSGNTVFSGGSLHLSATARALVTGGGPDAEAQAVERYWTPERMRAARPADQFLSNVSPTSAGAKTGAGVGLPDKIKPTGPSTNVGQPEKIEPTGPVADVGLPEKVKPTGPAAPRPQSFTPDLPPTDTLARTYGKVFFTDATDGLNYVCSGTVVNSIRRDTVWTAGHCVHHGPGGTFHLNWQFVPAFKDGIAPFGAWTADRLATRDNWINNEDFSEDIGAAVLARRDGRKIVDVVGGQGIAFNQPPTYFVNDFGYPQGPPFDGQKLIGCDGAAKPAKIDIFNIISLTCDMTGGSSGGGWLRELDQGHGYLNGHNDFKIRELPGLMFSPYYGEAARSLYYDVVNEV
jgi:V8-like Glu-specific endopeptidase